MVYTPTALVRRIHGARWGWSQGGTKAEGGLPREGGVGCIQMMREFYTNGITIHEEKFHCSTIRAQVFVQLS